MSLRAFRLAVAAFALLPLAARAEAIWLCGLSADLVRLVCVADSDRRDGVTTVAATAERPVATVNGTRFPLDTRRVYTVDLWSPPTEPERLLLLAQATMCYRTQACRVVMRETPR